MYTPSIAVREIQGQLPELYGLEVTPERARDIPALQIETFEGAKFWLRVMNGLKNRGFGNILIAVVDGLKGFAEAFNAVFPQMFGRPASSISFETR